MVPDAPKLDTPQQASCLPRFSATASVAPRRRKEPMPSTTPSRTAGFAERSAPLQATSPRRTPPIRSASRPTLPAAASPWPKAFFAPDTARDPDASRRPLSFANAPISMGSPSGVAVPWASTPAKA